MILLPHYSEFTYGFALTNEFVGLTSLNAAPIFPSLIEEGKSGGGYDVKLDSPGVPIFLQFKRSEKMVRPSARESKLVGSHAISTGQNVSLLPPYFRFSITDSNKSEQHKMLCDLDDGTNLVYYAAPSFYEVKELNDAWHDKAMIQRSLFVKPNSIGNLPSGQHRVAWNSLNNVWRCSKPEPIEAKSNFDLISEAKEEIEKRGILRNQLVDLLSHLGRIESGLLDGTYRDEKEAVRFPESYITVDRAKESRVLEGPKLDIRSPVGPKSSDEGYWQLRNVADVSSRLFGAQMLILQ